MGQHSCRGDQSWQLFSRDSDKRRRSHRMRRFAHQNLINRIDYGQQQGVLREQDATPLHGVIPIVPSRLGLSYYQPHWV